MSYAGSGEQVQDEVSDLVMGAALELPDCAIEMISITEEPELPDAEILPFKLRLVEDTDQE